MFEQRGVAGSEPVQTRMCATIAQFICDLS